MAQCTACGTETSLYVNGQPICPACDDRRRGITADQWSTPSRGRDPRGSVESITGGARRPWIVSYPRAESQNRDE